MAELGDETEVVLGSTVFDWLITGGSKPGTPKMTAAV